MSPQRPSTPSSGKPELRVLTGGRRAYHRHRLAVRYYAACSLAFGAGVLCTLGYQAWGLRWALSTAALTAVLALLMVWVRRGV